MKGRVSDGNPTIHRKSDDTIADEAVTMVSSVAYSSIITLTRTRKLGYRYYYMLPLNKLMFIL